MTKLTTKKEEISSCNFLLLDKAMKMCFMKNSHLY